MLDDVQFSKQSWQQRNNFKGKNGLEFFTVPIISNRSENLINEISIFNPNQLKKKFSIFLKTNYLKKNFLN